MLDDGLTISGCFAPTRARQSTTQGSDKPAKAGFVHFIAAISIDRGDAEHPREGDNAERCHQDAGMSQVM